LWCYDRHLHPRYHDETVNGLKTKSRFSRLLFAHGPIEVVLVNEQSPEAEIKLAEKFAKIASRNPRFDFSHFGIDTFAYDHSACCLLATHYIPKTGASSLRRIVGLLVLVSVHRTASLSWSDFDQSTNDDPPLWKPQFEPDWTTVPDRPLRGCSFVWVAPAHRRQGIARLLLTVAAAVGEQEREQFPCIPPFTDQGRTVLMALFPERVVIGQVKGEAQ
jgi:GNAT superfamily N-acetyltransferase